MGINRNSLSDQIYKQLKDDIILGNIPSGTKLTLKELQNRFEVSSTPVRDALNRLAQERFLDYITNQGVRVVALTATDVHQLLDVRCLYDCYAIETVMKLPDKKELIRELEDAIAVQKAYHEAPEKTEEDYSTICYRFHEILCNYTGNTWLISSSAQYNGLLFLADAKKKDNSYPTEAIEEHQAILDAIKEGDSEKAIEKMKIHREKEEIRFQLN